VLAGVVMRRDFVVDGVSVALTTLGGDDATEAIIEIFKKLKREDISVLMVSGSVISWYNVIDPERLHRETSLPTILVTYRASKGLEEVLKRKFPESWEEKIRAYKRLGPREKIMLATGKHVYVRAIGLSVREAKSVIDSFTAQGRYPEPIRVARLIARAFLDQLQALQRQRPPDKL
jgi:endonuclease V-like protein UPF0215 family